MFINSSFLNKKDIPLQIDYIIYFANATHKANITYWSLIKYKHVTHNVLATKFYKMTHGFYIGAVIKVTLRKILRFAVLLVLYIDSKLLYNYLIKLGIIQKKQLMIDKISLRHLYK